MFSTLSCHIIMSLEHKNDVAKPGCTLDVTFSEVTEGRSATPDACTAEVLQRLPLNDGVPLPVQ